MRVMRLFLVAIAVVLPATGCGDRIGEVDAAPGRWQTAEPLWIGGIDGDGPDVFGSIAALAADEDGRILVFDGQANELRVFGEDGSFLSRFGRRGGGPGEFQHAIGISVGPDGTLWIIDGANARYTVLREGEVATYARGTGVYTIPWVGGHSGGYLHDLVTVPGSPLTDALVRINAKGVAVDTFAVPADDIETPRLGAIRLPLPYAPTQIRAFDPGGALWVATSDEYRLHRIGFTGDTLQTVRREVEPRPLSATESDSVSRHIRTLSDEFRLEVREGLIPRNAPLLRQVTVADDGSVWVTRADPPAGSPSGTQFDLFDRDGKLIGELNVEFPLALRFVRNGFVYGVARDELDVERVFRARIERG